MLDGEETVEIACGELRWEGARQHAGRTGNRANILQRASLGGSETAHAGRIGNHANSLRRASLERERCSMLGGQETVEIACGELYRRERASWTETKPWKSLAESYAGRSETACWTDKKPCK